MKVEINTLFWDNGKDLTESHKQVMDHFGIPVNYHNINNIRPGNWMDQVLNNSKSDIIGFIDNDCVPINKDIIDYCCKYLSEFGSIIGIAQASNHIPPFNNIFVGPGFFFIHKDLWERTNKISMLETQRSDVCEEICRVLDINKVSYKAIYPTFFEKAPEEGAWRLGNYGYFGVGTIFDNSIYHLYQGRLQENRDLFKLRCEQIIDGTFSTKNMISSTNPYYGKTF
jgi:hypothetical protein